MPRWIIALFVVLGVAACSQRPDFDVLNPVDPGDAETEIVRVYVATTRARNLETGEWNGSPDYVVRHMYYDVSVPENRADGEINFPSDFPDLTNEYAVVGQGDLDADTFYRAVKTAKAQSKTQEVGVFVHGYNARFQEAVFRLAQLSADAGEGGVPILFTWPSAGKPLEYIGDRQAALFSRDALADLMDELTDQTGQTMVFAHSMGSFLTMEALRTLRLENDAATLDRLNIIMAAPDIDPFVFAQQMQTVGQMREPLILLVSPQDRALGLSAQISGGRDRLGRLAVDDPTIATAPWFDQVVVIDITAVNADPMGHSRFINVASLYSDLQGNDTGRPDLSTGTAFVFNQFGGGALRQVVFGQ